MEETQLVTTEEQIHQLASESAVTKIENSLSDYLQHVFTIAQEEDTFHKALQGEVLKRLPDLKNNELISMMTSNRTNFNDLISKVMNPTLQLATARQQAEMALHQKENSPQYTQNNIKELNTGGATTSIMQGMQTLQIILDAVQQKAVEEKSTDQTSNS